MKKVVIHKDTDKNVVLRGYASDVAPYDVLFEIIRDGEMYSRSSSYEPILKAYIRLVSWEG